VVVAAAGAWILIAAAACTDLGPDGAPASIAFDVLPYPSVVEEDTLRNHFGEPATLQASVLDTGNEPVPDAPVRFVALDSGVTITEEGYVIGRAYGQTVRIVAQVGQLQSLSLPVFVTRRPDRVHAVVDTEIIIEYLPGEVVDSGGLDVRVVHDTPPTPGDTVVPQWVVTYEIVGQAPGDTVPGYLVNANGTRRASADTTDASGVASLQFRLNSATLQVLHDTLEVRASVLHRGDVLPGSPVGFLLLIRPRTTS
jgi:hypothetical protein